jgi:hypothetical protein
MKAVKCKSGIIGWRDKLQNTYSSFDEFVEYCAMYGIHERLGYRTPAQAWMKNPLIEGSTNPADLRKVGKD